MTLRPRTSDDPPPVPYQELRDQLEQLSSLCNGLHYDTRYLPHENCIDEEYKAHRTLLRMAEVRRAVRLASELGLVVDELVRVMREPVVQSSID